MSKRANVKESLCGLWLTLCIVGGTIALFRIGIDSVLGGFAAFLAVIFVGLLPVFLIGSSGDDDFGEVTKSEPGFFSLVLLGIFKLFKIVFVVFAFIITIGCMLCAGKRR